MQKFLKYPPIVRYTSHIFPLQFCGDMSTFGSCGLSGKKEKNILIRKALHCHTFKIRTKALFIFEYLLQSYMKMRTKFENEMGIILQKQLKVNSSHFRSLYLICLIENYLILVLF